MTESEFLILEAYTRDVGQNIVRIDKNTMHDLSIDSGDIVEVIGKQRAVAKCLQLYPADEGKKIIRMDGLTRNNCKSEIGIPVFVRKTNRSNAESVMIAPLEAIPPIDPRYAADALNSVPLIPKQLVMVPYFGGRLTFMVVGTIPELSDEIRAVVVTPKTRFGIVDKKPFSLFSKRDVEDRRHDFLQKVWTVENMSKSEFDDFISKLTEFYKYLSNPDKNRED